MRSYMKFTIFTTYPGTGPGPNDPQRGYARTAERAARRAELYAASTRTDCVVYVRGPNAILGAVLMCGPTPEFAPLEARGLAAQQAARRAASVRH